MVIAIRPYQSLILSCQEHNIPCYDLQHGAIDFNDKFYIDGFNANPTNILCTYEISQIFLKKHSKVFLNPFLLYSPLISDYLRTKTPSLSTAAQPTILFTQQWGFGVKWFREESSSTKTNEFWLPHGVPKSLLESIVMFQNTCNVRPTLLIKLHPCEVYQEEIRNSISSYLSSRNINLAYKIIGVESNSLSLIAKSFCHVTYHSSCALDSLAFKIPTGLYCSFNTAAECFNIVTDCVYSKLLTHDSWEISRWLSQCYNINTISEDTRALLSENKVQAYSDLYNQSLNNFLS